VRRPAVPLAARERRARRAGEAAGEPAAPRAAAVPGTAGAGAVRVRAAPRAWLAADAEHAADAAEMTTHSPLGAMPGADVPEGPGPAREGPGTGPSRISPACQDAKLEDLEGLPAGRRRTARQIRRYLECPL